MRDKFDFNDEIEMADLPASQYSHDHVVSKTRVGQQRGLDYEAGLHIILPVVLEGALNNQP